MKESKLLCHQGFRFLPQKLKRSKASVARISRMQGIVGLLSSNFVDALYPENNTDTLKGNNLDIVSWLLKTCNINT